ncbi:MAG: sigma-70 family RNA polymerase sigma factor, partial [Methanosarcinaceae archaeon]|nr:sigma-70 family RNA polymerase sigma factor [Methanosarcinaceae archaeon]
MDDTKLLKRYAAGEEEAFQELMSRYRDSVYAFLRRFLSRSDLVEDVFQETFLQLFVSRDTFDVSRPLRPWLFTIAANKAKDALRRLQRGEAAQLGNMFDSDESTIDDVLDALEHDARMPYDDLIRDERAESVKRILARMPEKLREIGDELKARGHIVNSELKVKCKDGAILDGLFSGEIISSQGQNIFLTIMIDQTERKRTQEQLTQSHDLLSNLTRLVPGVVYQYRLYPDGRSAFPYSSAGMNDIYEVTPEEVREDATPVFGRLHPDDYEHVATSIQESARTLQTFYCEFRVILPRQGLRWR